MHTHDIQNLKQLDLYSLMLFALYKAREIPEYSSLSELAYALDKDSLLTVCELFGGQTITIPTISELESMTYSLVLYQLTNVEHIDYDEAIELIGHRSCDLRKVKSDYRKLAEVLKNYDFKSRNQ